MKEDWIEAKHAYAILAVGWAGLMGLVANGQVVAKDRDGRFVFRRDTVEALAVQPTWNRAAAGPRDA